MTNRSLALLSGEGTSLPQGEARALFLTYDRRSRFESPDRRVLIAESDADPFAVGARIAFARRVGRIVHRGEVKDALRGKRVRFRSFDLEPGLSPPNPFEYLKGVDGDVDLKNPELELTLVRGEEELLAVTRPLSMVQGWSRRRPRRRPFFHPSAIFPKLSRALVNLSRCREGDLFLDPFCGTGSIPMEAALVGARVLALDRTAKMAAGALSNMKWLARGWDAVVRGDCYFLPFSSVDAVATDVPYGRVSSTQGKSTERILEAALPELARVLPAGRHLALMHPQQVPVRGEGFSVLEEHHLHVHKLLTRTITILERR